jgi:curved DNA-binding protein CbpA
MGTCYAPQSACMSDLKPTATSRISSTPIPKLLAHATARALTGTVVLETPSNEKSAIFFEKGAPAKVMTGARVHFLGEALRDLGLIDDATYRQTVNQAVQERRLHGQVLIGAGKLKRQDLLLGLREQIRRKLVWLAEQLPSDTIAGYYEGKNLLERWGGSENTPVTALTLIWPCLRNSPDHEDIDKTLSKLQGRILRIQRAAQVNSFKLTSDEQALVDVMRGKPQSMEELLRSGFDPDRIRRLVYAFAIAHFLDLGSQAPPPMTAASPRKVTTARGRHPSSSPPSMRATPTPKARPSRTSEETDAFRAEILDRAETVEKQSYYEILGVDPADPNPTIQAAFFQLARRWHPDRMGEGLADLHDIATKIFSRMSEAHATLTDPERRQEYDRVLKEGGGSAQEQDQINAIVKAAGAFQKAEILLRRGKLKEAEAEARTAYEGDEAQAEYGALYAWISAQLLDPEDHSEFAKLIQIVNKAVEREKEHVRIRFYRGMVLKRAGRADKAIRDFKFVAEADPRNVDAQREIRLYRMRRGASSSSKPPAPKEGLLGKLFRK